MRFFATLALSGAVAVTASAAHACGAYFLRNPPATTTAIDAKLYNRSTRIVYARIGEATTVTMVADYRGNPREFAAVIAVPTVLTREQVRTVEAALVERIDSATAPRFTVRQDPDPCFIRPSVSFGASKSRGAIPTGAVVVAASPQSSVTVEARYVVGEYDVAILSASESDGLRKWLDAEGYQVPAEAEPVLAAYIREGLKFFVAKVALAEGSTTEYKRLSPLQISYNSPNMWVPLRLSTVVAEGPQDMFVFALTDGSEISAASMPTRVLDTTRELPAFVARDFESFYEAAVTRAGRESNGAVAIVESRWRLPNAQAAQWAWKISIDELGKLGIDTARVTGSMLLTRLHVRYDKSFAKDLTLQAKPAQGRLVSNFRIHKPYQGEATCRAAARYKTDVAAQYTREVDTLRRLTGWSLSEIKRRGG